MTDLRKTVENTIRGHEQDIWFAVLENKEDIDHGYGSEDLEEACKMLIEHFDNEDSYIAILVASTDFCLGEINRNDASEYIFQKNVED